MAMQCKKCKAELAPAAKFCSGCGTKTQQMGLFGKVVLTSVFTFLFLGVCERTRGVRPNGTREAGSG
jgi:uncharacterized OB-fold protein